MPEPLPLPIRVLVKGASMVVWTSYMGGPRSDLTYPRVIDQALRRAGHPSEVRVSAMAAERVAQAYGYWERDVVQFSPDAVILHYAHAETIHLMIPMWLERHANSLKRRKGTVRELYRKRLLRPAYATLGKLQAHLDRSRKSKLLPRRLNKVMLDLEYLIERISSVQHPLILIPILVPHGKNWHDWFPGAQERMDATNQAIIDLVAKIDKPNVRVFQTMDVLGKLEMDEDEEYTPDGGHFTPKVHRALGEAMAAEILEWAADHPHLALPGDDSFDRR